MHSQLVIMLPLFHVSSGLPTFESATMTANKIQNIINYYILGLQKICKCNNYLIAYIYNYMLYVYVAIKYINHYLRSYDDCTIFSYVFG